MVWKTHGWLKSPAFQERVGIRPGEQVVGYLQIGFPEQIPNPRPRTDAATRITWICEP